MRDSAHGSGLHLGIDASNIRAGGGLTHLTQMLKAAEPQRAAIEKVTIWCGRNTAAQLPDRPWLAKRCPPWADAALPLRILGQQIALLPALEAARCHVLFSPGGTLPPRSSVPTVTMSQNMLPFEPAEAARFGRWSPMRLKMGVLRRAQRRSFKRADGLIFLSDYARVAVLRAISGTLGRVATIPHGVETRFFVPPRTQRALDNCSTTDPFRLLYVSILMPYKHQIEVARAASMLRAEGLPLSIRFVGSDWGTYGKEFKRLLETLDKNSDFLHWSGPLPFAKLHEAYVQADAFIFASSCENLPNILIEAMSAGLPVACAHSGPMPEILGDAGLYFDPADQGSIAEALRALIRAPDRRAQLAAKAWERAKTYSWERCARQTFQFVADVARDQLMVNRAAPTQSGST